jgi:hypothetical protein
VRSNVLSVLRILTKYMEEEKKEENKIGNKSLLRGGDLVFCVLFYWSMPKG